MINGHSENYDMRYPTRCQPGYRGAGRDSARLNPGRRRAKGGISNITTLKHRQLGARGSVSTALNIGISSERRTVAGVVWAEAISVSETATNCAGRGKETRDFEVRRGEANAVVCVLSLDTHVGTLGVKLHIGVDVKSVPVPTENGVARRRKPQRNGNADVPSVHILALGDGGDREKTLFRSGQTNVVRDVHRAVPYVKCRWGYVPLHVERLPRNKRSRDRAFLVVPTADKAGVEGRRRGDYTGVSVPDRGVHLVLGESGPHGTRLGFDQVAMTVHTRNKRN